MFRMRFHPVCLEAIQQNAVKTRRTTSRRLSRNSQMFHRSRLGQKKLRKWPTVETRIEFLSQAKCFSNNADYERQLHILKQCQEVVCGNCLVRLSAPLLVKLFNTFRLWGLVPFVDDWQVPCCVHLSCAEVAFWIELNLL